MVFPQTFIVVADESSFKGTVNPLHVLACTLQVLSKVLNLFQCYN